jgi:isoquinoline 1-oxidoreductase alpha subunit
MRACLILVSSAVGKQITTVEAIGATPVGKWAEPALGRDRYAAVRRPPVRPAHGHERTAARAPRRTNKDIDRAMSGNI